MTERTLTTGLKTRNTRKYLDDWQGIAKKLSKRLDLATVGFDPGFLMRDNGGRGTVDIPLWLAKRILEPVKRSSGNG